MFNRLLLLAITLFASKVWAVTPDDIKQRVQQAFPGMVIDNVAQAPLPGWYEVTSNGFVLYSSNDGKYLMAGELMDITLQENERNLTEVSRKAKRHELMKELKKEDMVIFKPATTKAVVYVITDVDCGYCRKLHEEMPEMLKQGLEIRYMAFPRAGQGSETYTKMVSIWCAKNTRQAMDSVMKGDKIEEKSCSNPIEAHYKLGQKFGVRGTPTLLFPDGHVNPGYMPAAGLAELALKHQ